MGDIAGYCLRLGSSIPPEKGHFSKKKGLNKPLFTFFVNFTNALQSRFAYFDIFKFVAYTDKTVKKIL